MMGFCTLQRPGEVTKQWAKHKGLCSLLQGSTPTPKGQDTKQLQMATQAPKTGLKQGKGHVRNTSW